MLTYRFHRERTFTFVLAIIRFGLGCASTSQIDSHWTDQALPLDAKNTAWTNAQISIDDKGTTVGVFNDKDALVVTQFAIVPFAVTSIHPIYWRNIVGITQ